MFFNVFVLEKNKKKTKKQTCSAFSVEVIWEIIAEEEELNALSFVKLERAVGGINYFS